MNIWIDLTNSPHIYFFKYLIDIWEQDGHKIILTCRDHANTIDLIKLNGWNCHQIGGHPGKSIINKTIFFFKRSSQLAKYLRPLKPDLAISHSAFNSPITAKILGIPSIYINDNEHAIGNYIAFIFASKSILPDCLKKKAKKLKWNLLTKLEYYPGIKEGIYLSQDQAKLIRKKSQTKRRIYIRTEPWTAQYYKGSKFFFDKMLIESKNEYEIILLPRGQDQADYYLSPKFSGIEVQLKSLSFNEIIYECDLFIGAGGTMTREMASMGIPTISIYQAELLEVDKFLIINNFMLHEPNISKEVINNYLNNYKFENNKKLMSYGLKAFEIIRHSINEFN